jgi:hypothetical protein
MSFHHIFTTATLISVILAPKFLASFTLSFHAFIMHVCSILIDYVYFSRLGHVVPEPFSEDFQDQDFEEFQPFFTDQQGKLPWTCCTYEYFLYSVELELHDRKACCAHQCYGLTRIESSFLENHRNIWVVIIGLELLGLACPSLGLGSDYGYIIHSYVTPVVIMVILGLLVWRI